MNRIKKIGGAALGILWGLVRKPGAWMLGAGATIMLYLAAIGDISKINITTVAAASVTLIVAGMTSVIHVILTGRNYADVVAAMGKHTDAVNGLRDELKGEMRANTDAVNGLRDELKGEMRANTDRVVEAIDRLSGHIERLTERLDGQSDGNGGGGGNNNSTHGRGDRPRSGA